MIRSLFCGAAILLALASPLAGQIELFNQGNERYQEGDYEGAVASYSAVLEGGFESAELHYNLGNAHVRLGRLADAVLSYERASRLDPGNEDVVENLRLVNARLTDRIEPLPRFWLLSLAEGWMSLMPRSLLYWVSAISYSLLALALVGLVMNRPRGWRVGLTRVITLAGIATVIFGGTMVLRETEFGRPVEAVVMAQEVQVLSAPSTQGGLTVFTLHAGTKVRVDQRANEWAEVVLADGKVGWLPLDVLALI